jgi:hypothetical protein
MFHYIYHEVSLVNNLVRDIRASGTASETTEGINKPCHTISQTDHNKKRCHAAGMACRKRINNTRTQQGLLKLHPKTLGKNSLNGEHIIEINQVFLQRSDIKMHFNEQLHGY